MVGAALNNYFENKDKHPVCNVEAPEDPITNGGNVGRWIVGMVDYTTSPMSVLYMTLKLYSYVMASFQRFGRNDVKRKAGVCFTISVKYVCEGESGEELQIIRDIRQMLRVTTGITAKGLAALESKILRSVDYDLSMPLAPHFFYEFVEEMGDVTEDIVLYGEYCLEMSAIHFCLHGMPPHELAASCLYTARSVLGCIPVWTGPLIRMTRCGINRLFMPVAALCKAIDNHSEFASGVRVWTKYSAASKKCVATLNLPEYILDLINVFPPKEDMVRNFLFRSYKNDAC